MNKVEKAKEVIKKYMEGRAYVSAPTQDEMLEILEEEGITGEEFLQAVEQIGEELEKQGYELIWYSCKPHEADCQRFVVDRYPNERELTKEELDEVKEFLTKKMGYWNAVNYTFGWDLATDGEIVWVKGYREGFTDVRFWWWDEIRNQHQ